jgi:hypothetical protein
MASAVPTGIAAASRSRGNDPASAALPPRPLALWAVVVALAAALAAVLVMYRDLPMLDLPQHGVQIAIWMRWSELTGAERAAIELNLRTPYLVAYGLARALSPVVGVVPALKSLVWLAAVGNLLSLLLLARRLGHPAWLALLGLPLTFGFSFYFGFVSFLLATPLVVLAVTMAYDHASEPRWSSGLSLAALLCVTLVAHGFALTIAMFSVAPLLAWGTGATSPPLPLRVAPLLAPVAFALLWLTPELHGPGVNDFSISSDRLFRWLPMLLGAGSFRDGPAVLLASLFLILLVLGLGRPVRAPGRLGLLAVSVVGYALIPKMLWNTAFLHERCLSFLVPGLMLACQPRRSSPRFNSLIGVVATTACAIWLLVFSVRLSAFKREMADYDALIERLPAGLRVRPIIFDRNSRAFPGAPAYVHVSAYYHIAKGGLPAYWFAVQRNAVVRYREGYGPRMSPGSEWTPNRFDAALEAPHYDYFLVRGNSQGRALFVNSPLPIVLDACRGSFCGYRTAPASTSGTRS